MRKLWITAGIFLSLFSAGQIKAQSLENILKQKIKLAAKSYFA